MMQETNSTRVAVIQGSVRPGNYTAKAVRLVLDELERHEGIEATVVDPASLDLPFPGVDDTPDAFRLRRIVGDAAGVILATPEYHGGFSSVIKLVIENLGFPSGIAGKPVALLGVAAGQIGAIKSLEALASVCLHVGAIVLPGAVSVAHVRDAFDANGNARDPKTEARIRGVATTLIDYIDTRVCPRTALEAAVREAS